MEWRQCGLVWNVVQRSRWSRTTKFSYLVTKAGRRELEGREAVAGGREGGLLMFGPAGKLIPAEPLGQVLRTRGR